MTTASSSSPRALGRGVSQLIPSASASPAATASAALAALRTVQVHIGVVQAAVVLLEDAAERTDDPEVRAAVRDTVVLLREAIGGGPAGV